MLIKKTEEFAKIFLEKTKDKKLHLVSHYDTDGITSAVIFIKTLERMYKQFSLKIIKQLSDEEILALPKDKTIIFLDLGSGSLEKLSRLDNEIFIIDHHEIDKGKIREGITLINPHILEEYENLCCAELTYLISKAISEGNKDLAYLSIIGMVGDTMEKEISKTRNKIIKEANVTVKKGLLIYPSTRPLDKALEYSSRPVIPGVVGDREGTFEFLKEAGIKKIGKTYKALIDLSDEEMKNLVTAVMLRISPNEKPSDYIGNLYLVKFFNKIEDARELSAVINACSRMGHSDIALGLCLGNSNARKKAECLYVKYRQHIISGLKYIDKNEKIKGKEYIIINAKDKIKDTIIGTLASILSFSPVYEEGTIIIAMAYNQDKIKVSTRIAGRNPKNGHNLKKIMDSVAFVLGGESGGHENAAGCTISIEKEKDFIELIKKKFEFEIVKVNPKI